MAETTFLTERETIWAIVQEAAEVIAEQLLFAADALLDKDQLVFPEVNAPRRERILSMQDLQITEPNTLTELNRLTPALFEQLMRDHARDLRAEQIETEALERDDDF